MASSRATTHHTSWIIDDQPWPINVRGGQKFIFVPYTGQTNDAGMLAWNREADYFQQMIKDQFDTLYREGAENGRVMCPSLPSGCARCGHSVSACRSANTRSSDRPFRSFDPRFEFRDSARIGARRLLAGAK
jgi:hypothetical protein